MEFQHCRRRDAGWAWFWFLLWLSQPGGWAAPAEAQACFSHGDVYTSPAGYRYDVLAYDRLSCNEAGFCWDWVWRHYRFQPGQGPTVFYLAYPPPICPGGTIPWEDRPLFEDGFETGGVQRWSGVVG